MAVVRTAEIDGILEIGIEDPDLSGVHFTDESFDEVVSVRNISENRVTGTIELQSDTEQTLGLGHEPIRTITFEIDLEPGEIQREPLAGVGMVGGSGTGLIVGISSPEIVDDHEESHITVEPGDNLVPLVNIVFWDREFYRANYIWPRRAQYLSVAIALLSAVLAGMVVWLTLW